MSENCENEYEKVESKIPIHQLDSKKQSMKNIENTKDKSNSKSIFNLPSLANMKSTTSLGMNGTKKSLRANIKTERPRLKISAFDEYGNEKEHDIKGLLKGATKALLENAKRRKEMCAELSQVDTYNLFEDMVTDRSVVTQMHIPYLSKSINE